MKDSARAWIFSVVAGVALVASLAYFARAARRATPPDETSTPAGSGALVAELPASGEAFFLFRSTKRGPSYGSLAHTGADGRRDARTVPNLQCQRVHMAGGKGVCLASRGGIQFRARLFDERFNVFAELPLGGVPSRVQVSADGRLAGTTVFVSGHAYTDAGFSTQTSIVDLTTGKWLVENLETFTVRRRGQVVRSIDFNFWGVTFQRDPRHFFVTLGTRGETLLARGDLEQRTIEVVEDKVECPSLSPDNRRVAFKQRVRAGGPVTWEIWVLDLDSRKRWRLPEANSVDDQLQWLDDARIVYARPSPEDPASTDEWIVSADGTGSPQRYLANAYSGGLVKPAAASPIAER